MAEQPTITTSPVVGKKSEAKKGMSCFSALRKVAEGKMITKLEWGDPKIYGVLKDGFLMICGGVKGDERLHRWIISDGDLLGEDWVTV